MVAKDYKYTKEELDLLKSQYDGYGRKKDVIPKYTDYNGMIEFSKALRKYYEVSTPESREEIYKPWLSDNAIDTTGPWYKGHRKLRKEEDIVKDVVYVLATTLSEEVNRNHMNKKIKSKKHLSGPQRFYEDDIHLFDQQDPEPYKDLTNKHQTNIDNERAYLNEGIAIPALIEAEQPKDYACIGKDELETIASERKIEKRMQKITMAVTAVFGCILLYAILYKL